MSNQKNNFLSKSYDDTVFQEMYVQSILQAKLVPYLQGQNNKGGVLQYGATSVFLHTVQNVEKSWGSKY